MSTKTNYALPTYGEVKDYVDERIHTYAVYTNPSNLEGTHLSEVLHAVYNIFDDSNLPNTPQTLHLHFEFNGYASCTMFNIDAALGISLDLDTVIVDVTFNNNSNNPTVGNGSVKFYNTDSVAFVIGHGLTWLDYYNYDTYTDTIDIMGMACGRDLFTVNTDVTKDVAPNTLYYGSGISAQSTPIQIAMVDTITFDGQLNNVSFEGFNLVYQDNTWV